MKVASRGSSDQFCNIGMEVLGVVLAAVPLALWVSWSQAVFLAVVMGCAVALAAFVALAWSGQAEGQAHRAGRRTAGQVIANPEFIAELQRLMPFTYHHRRLGDSRIRRKLARARTLMGLGA